MRFRKKPVEIEAEIYAEGMEDGTIGRLSAQNPWSFRYLEPMARSMGVQGLSRGQQTVLGLGDRPEEHGLGRKCLEVAGVRWRRCGWPDRHRFRTGLPGDGLGARAGRSRAVWPHGRGRGAPSLHGRTDGGLRDRRLLGDHRGFRQVLVRRPAA